MEDASASNASAAIEDKHVADIEQQAVDSNAVTVFPVSDGNNRKYCRNLW